MTRASLSLAVTAMLLSCGGGGSTGNPQDSGANKTTLTVEASGVSFAVEDGWLSPRYGVREPTTFLRARRRASPGDDVTVFTLRPGASHDEMRGNDTNAV